MLIIAEVSRKRLESHWQDYIRKGMIFKHSTSLHVSPGHSYFTQTLSLSKFALLTPFALCWSDNLFHHSHFLTSFPAPQCIVLWFASVLWSPFWTLRDKKTVVYFFFPKAIGTGNNKGYPLACWSGTLMCLALLQLACKLWYCRMNRCSVLCTAHSQWGATQLRA